MGHQLRSKYRAALDNCELMPSITLAIRMCIIHILIHSEPIQERFPKMEPDA
jgi:hypothetical protein